MLGLTGTRIYTVHAPASGRVVDRTIFVRDGFSWGAAVFSALWAVWNRMWFAALLMLAALAALQFLGDVLDLDPAAQAVVGIAVAFYFGLEGNNWYRAALTRRGYREVGVVLAPSLIDAEQRWFGRHFEPATGTPG